MSRILNPLKWTHRLRARFRIWLKLCPRCNSDAPAVDSCWVCWDGNLIGKNDKQIIKNRWRSYGVTRKNERDFILKYKSRGKKPLKYDWPTK